MLKDTDFIEVSSFDTKIKLAKYFNQNKIYNLEGKRYIAKKRSEVFLRLGTAKKLSKANRLLKRKGFGILLYEGYRSYELQSALRDHYKYLYGKFDPVYVSAPGESDHQKGAAVDIGLYNRKTGNTVKMPTKYLELNEKARIGYTDRVPSEVLTNLKVMQEAMSKVGFVIFKEEWWHFNDKEMINKVKPYKLP